MRFQKTLEDAGIRSPTCFLTGAPGFHCGESEVQQLIDWWKTAVLELGPGTSELACHPETSAAEPLLFCSPKFHDTLSNAGIQVCSFAEL
jgi:hypothetical protein